MGDFIVLNDSTVNELLLGLSKNDIVKFQAQLSKAILDFSTTKEREYQPSPGVVVRPNGSKLLFRPFTSPTSVGAKIVMDSSAVADADKSKALIRGIVALCNEDGSPAGVLNAEALTGYRTSLSALIPYMWRKHTERIVVFGAGTQGLWHTRLALALRGSEIKEITIVNRTAARAESLMRQVQEENGKLWKSGAKMEVLAGSEDGYEQKLKEKMSRADIVLCTATSYSPLFPAEYLTNRAGDERAPYVSAVGSWQPNMLDFDPALIRYVVDNSQVYNRKGDSGGFVLIDDRDSALKKAGDVIQSGIKAEEVIEVGHVLGLQTDGSQDQKLMNWISHGFVVYKNIGVSLTDLAAGNAILSLARERNLGLSLSDF